MADRMVLALIGGSVVESMPGFVEDGATRAGTPWGEPSAAIRAGRLCGARVLWLARHGEPHAIAPHRINYRANLHALQVCGATHVLALHAVGGIAATAAPGTLWLPDQLIDYTWGRAGSFHDGEQQALAHIEFAEPFDAALRAQLRAAAAACAIVLQPHGIYGCTQGPRLETAAEIGRMQRDGCELVGMTAMPEAALARELGLAYASLSMVVNRAAGLAEAPITMKAIRSEAAACVERIGRVVAELLRAPG